MRCSSRDSTPTSRAGASSGAARVPRFGGSNPGPRGRKRWFGYSPPSGLRFGTDLAEHSGKIDQYVTVDASLRLNKPDDPLHPLHQKLYRRNAKHGGSVYYALVCRVVLGTPTRAKNGSDDVDGQPLWADSAAGEQQRELASGRHALLGELGETIVRFREAAG